MKKKKRMSGAGPHHPEAMFKRTPGLLQSRLTDTEGDYAHSKKKKMVKEVAKDRSVGHGENISSFMKRRNKKKGK
jgi:hypothetical protein